VFERCEATTGSTVGSAVLFGDECNTLGVYRLLGNEYEFKHIISVDKSDAKF
jgi:hypothetical protein